MTSGRIHQLIIIVSLVLFLDACNSQKVKESARLNKVITEFMGEGFESAANASQSLLLTWVSHETNETPILTYAVWDIQKAEKIYSGTAIRGKVAWLDDMSLELYDYPGIIDDNNPLYRYKIDLIT